MRTVIKICLLAMLWPVTAIAQVMPEYDDVISIAEQPDPDFDPLGIPVRSFLLHPALEIREEYNDNIFAAPSNEESDFITNIRPTLAVRSNWDLHALRFFTGADIGVHADNSNEDYEDFRVGVAGRYDVAYSTFFDGELRYDRAHEDRSSPDDAESDEPTGIDIASARIGFTRALAKLKLFVNGRVRDIEFENANAAGAVIDNSFRNRVQSEADVRLAYEFIPNYEVFIRGVYDRRDYETTLFPDRSSEGFRVEAGTAVNISGKLKGEIHGGYIAQDYGGGFDDINTGDFGGSLLWNASGLTSLRLGVEREVIETTDVAASGYIRTSGIFQIEHAFADNILAIARVTYDEDDYVGITRDDETYSAGFDIEYKLFRGMETTLSYDYRERDSTLATEDFSNHRVMFRVGYTF